MRLLHTADWHLGAELKHVQRLEDQLERVEEVLSFCDAREVDVLLVAGDFIDESRSDRLTYVLSRLGALLRPRLTRGLQVVVIAGNHDREWVFPLLETARELFGAEAERDRVQFVWKPELRVLESVSGDRVRLLCLPYPRQRAYDLEAITFRDVADRHKQMADAVAQRVQWFQMEIREDKARMPTVTLAHLLIQGIAQNGAELTEEADVPIPRNQLPNYAYTALGHVHLPSELGASNFRYSGSLEKMDFGEKDQPKEVVIFELDKTALAGEPEAIPLHPTELRELEWKEGDDLISLARGVGDDTICKLKLLVPPGTNVQAIQAEASRLFARLCWPPEIVWEGNDRPGSLATGSLAIERADWQGAVRSYLKEQVAEDDPDFAQIMAAAEQLLAEAARS